MAASLPYPALHATHGGIWIATADGGVEAVGRGEAIARAAETPMIMLNAPLVGNRLGYPDLSGLDLLELFAFVHPARFAVPTPNGLAHALDLEEPADEGEAVLLLRRAASVLLDTIGGDWPEREGAWATAQALGRLRWPWSAAVTARLGRPERDERWLFSRLPEWEENGGRPQPRPASIAGGEAVDRLQELVGRDAEPRQGQRDYAAAAAAIFAPRRQPDHPNLLLAEAGTGIGKTLAYLAPASLWAAKADGAVWISTYTKALQRQLDRESGRLYADGEQRRRKVVIRKGRENYLCLLNLEDALQGGFAGRAAVLAQLVARWAAYSKDGDMVGGDLPGWLTSLFRRAGAAALTDRRGECVYAGCPHYRRCFIERSARASQDAGYGIETELAEPDPALVDAAAPAVEALELLVRPLIALGKRLEAVIEDSPDWLDPQARARVEGAIGGLGWRVQTLQAWIALASRIGGPADPDFVDWLAVERVEGREYDVGLHRRWLDPTRPLAETVLKPAHGILVTSATLRGGGDWSSAEARTGACHLPSAGARFEAASPFDYAANSEVLIVTDVRKGDPAALAGAYARLIEAADGGTLGLFTAVQRLRAVHARIADRLARAGLPLYAQHVDPIDTGTLVDIFRDDPRASLLGTDALRDGVDIPGESLRLVVMEGVPWPRPTVLHSARRAAGGGGTYDDRVVRARLAQAFGRLIRRQEDRGLFVLLSAATPSRLLSAFPPGVSVSRVHLADAIDRVRTRLSSLEPAIYGERANEDSDPAETR